ncbi:hypothetical protein F3Y22_tig00111566pilonHSYRG00055 [Hibiscus syriacus]|uniref:Uncharacterized protein n=1 Tax=Hibiscus syriacus TaxID=106335 RepID=A0A6A2XKV9_HIBSY|nr:hypothetical protein F3Y22_tig00111566pilonHSYRG00055 [Hibiscus syriacus]
MVGAQAIDQGDCSNFKTNIPRSYERSPAIIDLLPVYNPDDMGVFYGVKDSNELLMGARNGGNVHSEMIFRKEEDEFTLDQGWVFPRILQWR